jgi:RNA polymerase sigma-70 factor (ECF subfamily)
MDSIDREDWLTFRQGKAAGLERIYRRHKDKMYTYCLYITGDHELSKDVVQETFVKLMEQKVKLDSNARIKDWLFVCARNLTYNHLKRRSRRSGSVPRIDIDDLSVETDVETRLFIENVLNKLAPEERELILLREQQRFSVREISTMLGISDEATRVRLYRIRKKMQQIAER